jgi:8-oxo-dGTP pyrophosphatase MutT (NUDIX family)
MDRAELMNFLQNYTTGYSEESVFIQQFLTLLSHSECYQRTHLPGHITGSAWIVDSEYKNVLLVHHAKLKKWMQPGGHADGDENILNVALKEAREETGLTNFIIPSKVPFDLDIHSIPERKDIPEHLHFDIRFLLEANSSDQIIVSEESLDVKWVPISDLEKYSNERSVVRMKEKLL